MKTWWMVVMLCGCTSGGHDMEVREINQGKITEYTDTRDSEKFSFRAENVSGVRVGFFGADTCFKVLADDGKSRTLCESNSVWLKCSAKGKDK